MTIKNNVFFFVIQKLFLKTFKKNSKILKKYPEANLLLVKRLNDKQEVVIGFVKMGDDLQFGKMFPERKWSEQEERGFDYFKSKKSVPLLRIVYYHGGANPTFRFKMENTEQEYSVFYHMIKNNPLNFVQICFIERIGYSVEKMKEEVMRFDGVQRSISKTHRSIIIKSICNLTYMLGKSDGPFIVIGESNSFFRSISFFTISGERLFVLDNADVHDFE